MKRIGLLSFAWLVVRDVNRTLGGGQAAIELLRRRFTADGSIDDRDHEGLVAVSRLTPGTNILSYSVALGWSLHGWAGALLALAAASVPAALIVSAMVATLVRVDRYPLVRVALAIGVLVASALVFASAWALMRPYLRQSGWVRTAVVAALSCALLLAGLTPIRILLVGGLVGAVFGTPLARSRIQ